MNRRDVKKILKEDWQQVKPSERVRSETKRALFGVDTESEQHTVKSYGMRRSTWHRAIGAVAAAVIVAIVVTAVLVWLPPKGGEPVGPGGDPTIPDGGGQGVTVAYAEAYGFSAMSSGMVLLKHDRGTQEAAIASVESGARLASGAAQSTLPSAVTPEEDRALIERIDGYMELVESILAGGGLQVTAAESDRAGYQMMLKTELRDLEGRQSVMTLYYNERLYEQDKEEREYRLEGVMELDGTEYTVSGVRSVETEDGESEEELEFVARSADGTRVEVELETEAGEQEYSYTIYNARGDVIDSFSIEAEQERGRTEVELLLGADRATGIRFYEEERGGVRTIVGTIAQNGVQRDFVVTVRRNPSTGEEQYEYTIGEQEIIRDKDDLFDDDDGDRDDDWDRDD